MRRPTTMVLALTLALAVPVVSLAILLCSRPMAMARATVALIEAIGPPLAVAETTPMEFRRVPPESVTTLEQRYPARSRVRVSVDASPQPAVPPAAPEVTQVGQPPRVPAPPERVRRAGDLTRLGADVHVREHELVRGDVTAIRGDVTVDGTVEGGVVAFGGNIYLNPTARVEGDVVCIGGELHDEPGAYVSGQRVTVLGGRGERIARRLHFRPLPRDAGWCWGGLRPLGALMRFLVAIGLTVLVAWLFRSRIAVGAETLKRQPALSLGIGALVHALLIPSLVALALVMALLCITIVGIPLALAALAGYVLFFVVFWLFGLAVGATAVGARITAHRGAAPGSLWQSALLGVLVVGGVRFAGRLLEAMGVAGLGGLGTLLVVLATLTAIVLGTMGGGAWLKWEFTEGLFGRWRRRREGRNGPGAATAPPSPCGPPSLGGPPAAVAPTAPLLPPEAYMPPGQEPPPSGPAPGA